MFHVYVLRSLKDGHLYIGSTSNLRERLKSHRKGKVRSTKGRRPLELVYYEAYETKTEARKREIFLKTGKGRELLYQKLSFLEG